MFKIRLNCVRKLLCPNDTISYIYLKFPVERVMNGMVWKNHNMVEKDYTLYETKILNIKTQEIGLLICLWKNRYADKAVGLRFELIKMANTTALNLIIQKVLNMILRNKLTKETLDIPYSELRKNLQKKFLMRLKVSEKHN